MGGIEHRDSIFRSFVIVLSVSLYFSLNNCSMNVLLFVCRNILRDIIDIAVYKFIFIIFIYCLYFEDSHMHKLIHILTSAPLYRHYRPMLVAIRRHVTRATPRRPGNQPVVTYLTGT